MLLGTHWSCIFSQRSLLLFSCIGICNNSVGCCIFWLFSGGLQGLDHDLCDFVCFQQLLFLCMFIILLYNYFWNWFSYTEHVLIAKDKLSSCLKGFGRGLVTYGVAKILSKVIQLLVGKSPNHIQSTSDFVSKAKGFILQPGECLSSYVITSLFTSVPNRSSSQCNQRSIGKGLKVKWQNSIIGSGHHRITWVLSA